MVPPREPRGPLFYTGSVRPKGLTAEAALAPGRRLFTGLVLDHAEMTFRLDEAALHFAPPLHPLLAQLSHQLVHAKQLLAEITAQNLPVLDQRQGGRGHQAVDDAGAGGEPVERIVPDEDRPDEDERFGDGAIVR